VDYSKRRHKPSVPTGAALGFVCSYQEIADSMGVSHQRVMQLEQQALRKLRQGLAARGYDSSDLLHTPVEARLLLPQEGDSYELH